MVFLYPESNRKRIRKRHFPSYGQFKPIYIEVIDWRVKTVAIQLKGNNINGLISIGVVFFHFILSTCHCHLDPWVANRFYKYEVLYCRLFSRLDWLRMSGGQMKEWKPMMLTYIHVHVCVCIWIWVCDICLPLLLYWCRKLVAR